MNWLFATARFPWPLADGQWLRVYHLARTLAAAGDVAAVLSYGGSAEARAAYTGAGVSVLPAVTGVPVERGRGRAPLAPYAFDPALAAAVAQAAGRFDAVVLSGARMMQYAPEAARARAVVADLIDDTVLEYRRRREHPAGWRPWLRAVKNRLGQRRYERRFATRVGAVTFVSDTDCDCFRRRHPGARVECVPNGVDATYFARPASPAAPPGTPPPRVVFTGNMANSNNERAATFLVRDVAPLVWAQRPDARVRLVGAEPTPAVRSLAGDRVEVTGAVADLRPYLWDAAAVAVPMQSGTGIKNKLLEAWAAGAAVVATPLACQGVRAEPERNVLLGHSAAEFAQQLVRAIGNPALRDGLGAAGRRMVEQHYTWPAATEGLRGLVQR